MARTATPIDVHVGARIRLRRLLRQISQERLSDAIGVTVQQLQKYEKGTNRISASRLYEIAHTLDVAVDFFYQDVPTNFAADIGCGQFDGDEIPQFIGTREGFELNRAFIRITQPTARRAIVDLIRSLSEGVDDAPDLVGSMRRPGGRK